MKQIITILCCFSLLTVEAQTKTINSSFDKSKAEQLIIGEWQQMELWVKCDEIKGFNEAMDNPMARAVCKNLANGTSLQFDSGGKVISMALSRIETSHYQISDGG